MGARYRIGRVSSVDEKAHTARVNLSDANGGTGDDGVTGDLQVLVRSPGDYSLPKVDALVACLVDTGGGGEGCVLGILYSDSDAAPLDDKGKRSIVSDDLRLGTADATDKLALAPRVNGNFNKLKQHFAAVEDVITGAPIPEPGNGSPSAFQAALAAAIGIVAYPDPDDVAAEKVSAK